MLKAFVYNYEFVMPALSSPSPLVETPESFLEIYVLVTHSVNIIKYLGKNDHVQEDNKYFHLLQDVLKVRCFAGTQRGQGRDMFVIILITRRKATNKVLGLG